MGRDRLEDLSIGGWILYYILIRTWGYHWCRIRLLGAMSNMVSHFMVP